MNLFFFFICRKVEIREYALHNKPWVFNRKIQIKKNRIISTWLILESYEFHTKKEGKKEKKTKKERNEVLAESCYFYASTKL